LICPTCDKHMGKPARVDGGVVFTCGDHYEKFVESNATRRAWSPVSVTGRDNTCTVFCSRAATEDASWAAGVRAAVMAARVAA
jgi:hypothetical protein